MISLSGFDFDKNMNLKCIAKTVQSGSFILGPSVIEFEKQFAAYSGSPDCVATSCCTDALRLCLQAMRVKAGDTVAVPSFTWLSTAEVVKQLNANCLFIDINDSLTIDTDDLEEKLSHNPECKTIIFVDLFGNIADIKKIQEIANKYDCNLLEDAAQATGARYNGNSLYSGHPVCYSFYPTKNLSCWGDAGAVACSEEFADALRSLRNHGQNRTKFNSDVIGWNSRMDSIQADILLEKLPYLDTWNQRRRDIASLYKSHLTPTAKYQRINTDCEPVYHQFTIITDHAEQIYQHCLENNIQTRIYYSTPIHQLPVYKNGQELLFTESIASKNICIPVHQYLQDDEVEFIIKTVNECL